jgi:hypothetical protein
MLHRTFALILAMVIQISTAGFSEGSLALDSKLVSKNQTAETDRSESLDSENIQHDSSGYVIDDGLRR